MSGVITKAATSRSVSTLFHAAVIDGTPQAFAKAADQIHGVRVLAAEMGATDVARLDKIEAWVRSMTDDGSLRRAVVRVFRRRQRMQSQSDTHTVVVDLLDTMVVHKES